MVGSTCFRSLRQSWTKIGLSTISTQILWPKRMFAGVPWAKRICIPNSNAGAWGWKNSSVVKGVDSSCKGYEFGSTSGSSQLTLTPALILAVTSTHVHITTIHTNRDRDTHRERQRDRDTWWHKFKGILILKDAKSLALLFRTPRYT